MPLTFLLATAAISSGPTMTAPAPAFDDARPHFTDRVMTDYRFDPAAVAFQSTEDVEPPADEPPVEPLDKALDDVLDDPGEPVKVGLWEVPGPPPYGQTGTTRWYIHFDRGWEFYDSHENLFLAGVGASHFIDEGLSLTTELNAAIFNQRGIDGSGVNFNLLFRYHYILEPSWSAYVDAGAGIVWTSEPVPPKGSKFNFTPQAGFGFTFDLGIDLRLMAGLRWHHLSNADLFDDNPGRDSIMVYAGINLPF